MKLAKKIIKSHLPRLVAIILMILAFFSATSSLLPMLKTARQLDEISDEIRYIEERASNSQKRWDAEDVKEYNDLIALRNELINSKDPLISKFAGANNLKRMGMFFSDFAMALIMAYCAYRMIRSEILSIKKIFK